MFYQRARRHDWRLIAVNHGPPVVALYRCTHCDPPRLRRQVYRDELLVGTDLLRRVGRRREDA